MHNPYAAPDAVLSEPIAEDGLYTPAFFAIDGRIGRLRYLAYSSLIAIVIGLTVGMASALLFGSGRTLGQYAQLINYITVVIPGVIMGRRRFHDLDHSGWFCLLMLVPYVNGLVNLYLFFGRGTDGANRYGAAPSKNTRLVIAGSLLIPLVAILGILAAIAIPAYQSYTQRAIAAKHATGI